MLFTLVFATLVQRVVSFWGYSESVYTMLGGASCDVVHMVC
jgi:hypothetical protein